MKAVDLLRRKIEDGTARPLLTSAAVHWWLRLFAGRESVPNQYGIELVRSAYLQRKQVAFTSLFFPPELATALGMIPFPLAVAAAMISASFLAFVPAGSPPPATPRIRKHSCCVSTPVPPPTVPTGREGSVTAT